MPQSLQTQGVRGKIERVKRVVGYSSTFGLLGYFLIPVIPAMAAIVIGVVVVAVVAKKLGNK